MGSEGDDQQSPLLGSYASSFDPEKSFQRTGKNFELHSTPEENEMMGGNQNLFVKLDVGIMLVKRSAGVEQGFLRKTRCAAPPGQGSDGGIAQIAAVAGRDGGSAVGIQNTHLGGTQWTAMAHVITGVIGAGVLSLAWSVAQLGWIAGPVMLIVFAGITVFSTYLLCDCYRSPDPEHGPTRNSSYTQAVKFYLVLHVSGGKNQRWCGLFANESLYGAGIAYNITAASSVRYLLLHLLLLLLLLLLLHLQSPHHFSILQIMLPYCKSFVYGSDSGNTLEDGKRHVMAHGCELCHDGNTTVTVVKVCVGEDKQYLCPPLASLLFIKDWNQSGNSSHLLNDVQHSFELAKGPCDDDGRPMRTVPMGKDLSTRNFMELHRSHNYCCYRSWGSISGMEHCTVGMDSGAISLFCFAIVTYVSAFLLSDCYRSPHPVTGTRNYCYMDAVRVNLGGKRQWFCGLLQYVNLYGTGTAYVITTATCMRAIQRSNCYHKEGHNASCAYGDTFYMLLFGVIQIVMSQIPDFHNMEWLSIVAAIMSFSYASIGLGLGFAKVVENGMIKGSIEGISASNTADKIWLVFQALGDIAFAYPYSLILLEIQDTLKAPPPENKTMKKASMSAILITLSSTFAVDALDMQPSGMIHQEIS
ncbi:putative amino acid permease 7 [Vitis vinifera]|uniref:Putative amino acid permease 7 n=1 Tax=Vitis vinifera TaxID=29760 RepID=A0A438EQX4_VITVI|nr:putative amino acid permease 7 [Vitis vinifera]